MKFEGVLLHTSLFGLQPSHFRMVVFTAEGRGDEDAEKMRGKQGFELRLKRRGELNCDSVSRTGQSAMT